MEPNEVKWVDHHCHLDENYEETIRTARESGVVKLVDIGCDVEGAKISIARAKRYDGLYATAGIHPHQASQSTAGLEDIIKTGDPVAIGECGLDFYYDHSERSVQANVFAEQIALAKQYELPLVIHTRQAWDETFDILETEGPVDRIIFHCFTGGVQELSRCLELDAYISFSGIVTFKNATEIREAAKVCPIDRILVETDSPYLAPVPYRGKKNQPAYVPFVGAEVAKLREISVEQLSKHTWDNTHRAYPALEESDKASC